MTNLLIWIKFLIVNHPHNDTTLTSFMWCYIFILILETCKKNNKSKGKNIACLSTLINKYFITLKKNNFFHVWARERHAECIWPPHLKNSITNAEPKYLNWEKNVKIRSFKKNCWERTTSIFEKELRAFAISKTRSVSRERKKSVYERQRTTISRKQVVGLS